MRATLANMRLPGFAKALIPACLVVECASALDMPTALAAAENGPYGAAPVTIERCVDDRSVRDLNAIRDKADVSRTAIDGPPPAVVALNDSFATAVERGDIARWLGIRNRCHRQLFPSAVAAGGASIGGTSLQQATALSRILQSGLDRLIRALYYRELTYGEFVRKKYQIVREAADLDSSINVAGHDADRSSLEQTVRRLLYLKITWNVYLRRLNARPPGTVHNRGAIYTGPLAPVLTLAPDG